MTKMKGKKKKKNKLGFTKKQLSILLNYCVATRGEPKITYKSVHKNYTTYSRRKSTTDLIKKAYEKEVVTGPFLYVDTGIHVSFMDDVDNPMELLEKYEKVILLSLMHCTGIGILSALNVERVLCNIQIR